MGAGGVGKAEAQGAGLYRLLGDLPLVRLRRISAIRSSSVETLPIERTAEFSEWMESELETLEEELALFITANSLHRSLRRR